MDFGLIIVLLVLTGYVGSLFYLNSKAKLTGDKRHDLPATHSTVRRIVNIVGLGFYGFVFLVLLIVAISVMFFRQDFLPR